MREGLDTGVSCDPGSEEEGYKRLEKISRMVTEFQRILCGKIKRKGVMIVLLIIGIGLLLLFGYIFGLSRYNEYRCKKHGHDYVNVRHKIMVEGGRFRGVCTDWLADIPTCKRWGCGDRQKPILVEELEEYTSVSMPTESWDKLRRQGYLVED